MIIGIGIDSIEIDRVKGKVSERAGFREKIFSPGEIQYCEGNQNPFQHYAARFAAKEAFLKAVGMGLQFSYELSEIEVVNEESGQPTILLHRDFLALMEERKWKTIHVSLTHTLTIATAIVIIES